MSIRGLATFIGAALLVSTAVPCDAALITFSDRGLFNLAAPGLTIETFESGLVAPASLTVCNGPLSSSAASACFGSGSLAPGVTYSASPGPSLVVIGAGFAGPLNASKVLGPVFFADTLNLTFAAANAVGLDVYAGPASGNVLFSVFSPVNVLLGSFTVVAQTIPQGTSFGVVSDAGPIGRLNVASQAIQPGELVDNVAFGTPVPEPASIVLLSIGLGAARLAARRRRTS
jgi:hypothetical protein